MTLVVLLGLAVARLTRLIKDDAIATRPREWVEGWLLQWGEGDAQGWRGWLLELMHCPFCIAGWLSILAVLVVDSATSRSIALPFLSWLAVWWVANAGYFALEVLADGDAILWHRRQEDEDDE